MKIWILQLIVAWLLLGCANIDKAPANIDKTLASIEHTQTSYKINKEHVNEIVRFADRQFRFFPGYVIGNTGFPIYAESDKDYKFSYYTGNKSNSIGDAYISFECDYTQGETHGELKVAYWVHPVTGAYHLAVFNVSCIPMSAQQVEAEKKADQEAEQARKEREAREAIEAKEREQREAQEREAREEQERRLAEEEQIKKAAAEKEQAYRNSPAFKRDEAQQAIRNLRYDIKELKQRVDEEHRIGLMSGYEDRVLLHQLASNIVRFEKEMQWQWQIYKANGGSAASLSEIK